MKRVALQPVFEQSRTRPRDIHQLAKFVLGVAKGMCGSAPEQLGKNPAAVALTRLGGLRGGKARAESPSVEQRSTIARTAAQARFGKRP